jgi:hypothetical protein
LKADQARSTATIQSLTEERDRLQGDKEQLVSRVVQGAGTVVLWWIQWQRCLGRWKQKRRQSRN